MSVLVVGVSHRTAPLAVLEQLTVDAEGVEKLLREVASAEYVREATVLSTCNRIEIYADVDRFHGAVEVISRLLCERSDGDPEDIVTHLYVHYDDATVAHLFQVAAGLESMVVGEGQILGQARDALRLGQESGTIGPALNALFQQALRVGKRAHAETDLDRFAPSLVSVALERAAAHIGPVAGKHALVLGAGSMAALAAATLSRLGAGQIVVANRTEAHAEKLAAGYGARAVGLEAVAAELAAADLVITCTGSTGVVLTTSAIEAASAGRARPLVVIDLALPHDVDPAVAELPGVQLVTLSTLAEGQIAGTAAGPADQLTEVRAIVAEEVAAFLSARRSASVTPTVVALRTLATGVVQAELERLEARVPDLDPVVRAEVEHAVRRVADKLLHQPTVRVKELMDEDGTVSYADALARLFALDPEAVEAVTRAEGLS